MLSINSMQTKNGSGPETREEPENQLSRIKLANVWKKYHTTAGDYPALKGISTTFREGDFIGIIGKSGAGKTTLVNMITGVDHLTSGEIWINGTPIHTLNENQMAQWRGQNMGVVYQSFQLLPRLTLLENILLPMEFCGRYQPRESEEWALHLLEEVELQDHSQKLPSAISGGQHQRAAIARALANNPTFIIADEPTGNLDSVTAELVFQLFEKLVNKGKTVVIVSHDPSLSERANHIVHISDGEIVEEQFKKDDQSGE